MTTEFVEFNLTGRCTYINQLKKEQWPQWKVYGELTEEEKAQVNLGIPTDDYIIFDIDLGDKTDEEILARYFDFVVQLKKLNIWSYTADRTPHGFHVYAKFTDLAKYPDDVRKEIRKLYIEKLGADTAKISMNGVVSIPGKPHFKTGIVYPYLETMLGYNPLRQLYVDSAIEKVEALRKISTKVIEGEDFKNFFEDDPFWKYIKSNVIPDGTNRDTNLLPNLAVAAVLSGKTDEEIHSLISPVLQKNFPGKNWKEFEGWLRKVKSGKTNDYNRYQINQWMRQYSVDKKDLYDLTPVVVEQIETNEKSKGFTFYWDDELKNLKFQKTEWLVDKWIAKNDICFIAGKSSSFKTTAALHMAYAIAEGRLVFNKYESSKEKILYLNEENSSSILMQMLDRVKKGLTLDSNSRNIAFSILENIRLDKANDLEQLIEFINKNEIKVLFCDSFRRFISFDENNATEMNMLFNNLKVLRKRCEGLTIIIIHHLKKEGLNKHTPDLRDMLRGSSDIVNSADSIIGMSRKHGCNAIKVEHIKNRSGEEITNKLILIDSGEEKDRAYFYESDKEMDESKVLSDYEKCSEEIVKFLEDNNTADFARKDLENIEKNYSPTTMKRALNLLVTEGTLTTLGTNKLRRYFFNSS